MKRESAEPVSVWRHVAARAPIVLLLLALTGAGNDVHGAGGGTAPAFTLLGLPSQQLGQSVGISGDRMTMVIGVPGDGQGKAYVYGRYAQGWVLQATLDPTVLPSDPGGAYVVVPTDFGRALAMSRDGNTVIVGAPRSLVYQGTTRLDAAGAAYVFSRVGVQWSNVKTIFAPDAAPGDGFGNAVAVDASGAFAVVGARNQGAVAVTGHPRYNSWAPGAAYVFHFDIYNLDPTFVPSDPVKLTPLDSSVGDWFGTSVAISDGGNVVLVGAPGTGWNGSSTVPRANNEKGVAYAFAKATPVAGQPDAWTQQARIVPSEVRYQDGDEAGSAVALSADGAAALVGAPYMGPSTGGQGGVYAFQQSGGTWTQTQLLTPNNGQVGDLFGSSIALTGGKAVIGALYKGTAKASFAGAAYVFTFRARGGWSQTSQVSGTSGSYLGTSVALSADGNSVLVGAPGLSSASGAAYVYDLATAPVPTIKPDVLAEWPLGQYDDRPLWVTPVPGNYIVSVYCAGWPAGLAYTDGINHVWGTPTKAGRYKVTVWFDDTTAGYTGTKTYTLVVR